MSHVPIAEKRLLDIQQEMALSDEPKIAIDGQYRIVASNAAYEAKYGSDIVGKRCHAVSHGIDRPCDEMGEDCPLREARASGLPERVIHLHHTRTGQEHVDVLLTPQKLAEGGEMLYIETLTTIETPKSSNSQGLLVGKSSAFTKMLSDIHKVAAHETAVLLLGATGTGKEMVAQQIHQLSARSSGPFVPVDCSGIPDALFESELFGHEKGAFTGAQFRKAGLVESAKGGTLFLDEIGDMPLSQQVKLLRLVETNAFRRVGGLDIIRSDFRLVCATHQDLVGMVTQGKFRKDLYYRISVFPITLPNLRDRLTDVPEIASSLLKRMYPGKKVRIDSAGLELLAQYSFPGNIRELRNILERATLFSSSGTIGLASIERALRASTGIANPTATLPQHHINASKKISLADLCKLVEQHDGPLRLLADRLNISERTLYRKLARTSSKTQSKP
jgi:two-component system, NtrC family, response regulator HydG